VDGAPLESEMGSPRADVSLWNRPFHGQIAEDFVSSKSLLERCPAPSVKDLAQKALAGDVPARKAWLEFGTALAELISMWQEQFSLEKIVLGGQVAKDFELIAEPLQGLPVVSPQLKQSALYGVRYATEHMP
jgi:predicted NBD/HSP70 family sugar kinase